MLTDFAGVLRQNALVQTGDSVLVGLSGGGDSVVLLDLFRRLAPTCALTVRAAHLNHGIRSDSQQDVEFVRNLCRKWNIPLDVAGCNVPALAAGKGVGIEAVARAERRKFLLQTAADHDCRVIALGHHRDDQAETVLHRLLRGSGVTGLAAMQLQIGPWIRPLLSFPRERLRHYLAGRQLLYLEDQSNADLAFTRNRIRHQLLPLMRSFNPRIDDHLWRLSRQVHAEEAFWNRETDHLLHEISDWEEGGLVLDRPRLRELHPAVRRRLLRRALAEVRGGLLQISARHLKDFEIFVLSEPPQGELHLPKVWIGRRYQHILLRTGPPPQPAPFALELPGPGSYVLPGGEKLGVSMVARSGDEDTSLVEFDAAAVHFPLTVRTFSPGDRFRPSGSGGSKKLKDFFIDQKIDRWTRQRVPLVFGHELLWIVGMRRCEGLRPRAEGPILQLRILPGENRREPF